MRLFAIQKVSLLSCINAYERVFSCYLCQTISCLNCLQYQYGKKIALQHRQCFQKRSAEVIFIRIRYEYYLVTPSSSSLMTTTFFPLSRPLPYRPQQQGTLPLIRFSTNAWRAEREKRYILAYWNIGLVTHDIFFPFSPAWHLVCGYSHTSSQRWVVR